MRITSNLNPWSLRTILYCFTQSLKRRLSFKRWTRYVVGFLHSQETMECATWINLSFNNSASCYLTTRSWSGRLWCSCCRCSPHLVPWLLINPLVSLLSSYWPSLVRLGACLDGKPPAVAVRSWSYPAFWVNIACLPVSFANVFVEKNRLYCRSRARGKLTI